MARRQGLPFERQQAVALQIAERAVVGEHVEAIGRALERAAGPVTPVPAVAGVGPQHRRAFVGRQAARDRQQLVVGQVGRRIQGGGDDLDLAVGIEIRERHFVARLRADPSEERSRDEPRRVARGRQIPAPPAAAIRLIDACQERRHQLPQLREHQIGALPDFVERVRAHAEEKRFIRLPRAVEAHVRLGRRRQHPAQRVERLGADRRAVHAFGVLRRARIPRGEVRLHAVDERRVALERRIHRLHISIAKRALHFGGHVIAPASVQRVGVGHVPRRLLEVRHEAPPLEDLRQNVRDVFAGDVCPAELRDRVVAVVAEDFRVQLLRPFDAHRRGGGVRSREVPGELVEEQPSQRLGRARVPREERALDRFRQVRQREDVAVEIGEEWCERLPLVGRECFRRRDHAEDST